MHTPQFHSGHISSQDEGDCGAALVEFAIVAAGMLLGLLLFVDICYAVCNYFSLSGIAAEAVRSGGRVPELESVSAAYSDTIVSLHPAVSANQPSAADQENCDALRPSVTFTWCGHNVIHQRIKTMLDHTELQVAPTSIQYSSSFVPRTSGTGDYDSVFVTIAARYRGFLLVNWPIRVQAQGPYLF